MPEPVRALETEKIAEGRYCISDGITRCYLFVGAEKALLLDSGFGEFPIGEAVGAITDLPLLLLNSHSHADHCMGNDQFPGAAVYIQKEGVGRVRGGTVTEVAEGDSFDLGWRSWKRPDTLRTASRWRTQGFRLCSPAIRSSCSMAASACWMNRSPA